MLNLLVAAALTPISYSFAVGRTVDYAVSVKFDGFVPILGGKDGVFEVDMNVAAQGALPDSEGRLRTVSELKDFKVTVNGAVLPLELVSATEYFPKTTVSMSPFGAILATDAPDKKLPVRLPGLDIKRFPDITYLPIEFPAEGIESGKPFTFKKLFGDSMVTYEVTPTSITDDAVEMALKVDQHYEVLEDEHKNVVTDPKEADAKVDTDVAGDGTATFSRAQGIVTKLRISAVANSKVEDLATHQIGTRKLKTLLSIDAAGSK
jgi:hypothetical protein